MEHTPQVIADCIAGVIPDIEAKFKAAGHRLITVALIVESDDHLAPGEGIMVHKVCLYRERLR